MLSRCGKGRWEKCWEILAVNLHTGGHGAAASMASPPAPPCRRLDLETVARTIATVFAAQGSRWRPLRAGWAQGGARAARLHVTSDSLAGRLLRGEEVHGSGSGRAQASVSDLRAQLGLPCIIVGVLQLYNILIKKYPSVSATTNYTTSPIGDLRDIDHLHTGTGDQPLKRTDLCGIIGGMCLCLGSVDKWRSRLSLFLAEEGARPSLAGRMSRRLFDLSRF